MNQVISERIREIAQNEEEIAKLEMHRQMVLSEYSRIEIENRARDIYRIRSDGTLDGMSWGTSVYGHPILPLLMLYERISVDLEPLPRPTFCRRYGVTPEQFALLMEEGHILPNLYTYETDSLNGFVKHKEHSDTLAPVLLSKKPNVRINGLRRDALLSMTNSTGKSLEHLRREGEEILAQFSCHFSSQELRNLTDSKGLKKPIPVISRRWAYARIFCDGDSKLREAMNTFASLKDEEWTKDRGREFVRFVQLLYLYRIGYITGAFGQVLNESEHVFSANLASQGMTVRSIETQDSRTVKVDELLSTFMQYVLQSANHEVSGFLNDDPLVSRDHNGVPTEQQFVCILKFLQKRARILEDANKVLQNAYSVQADYEAIGKAVGDYFLLLSEVQNEAKSSSSLWNILSHLFVPVGAVSGGILGMAAARRIKIALPEHIVGRRVFLGLTRAVVVDSALAGTGGIVGNTATAGLADCLAPILSNDKTRLLEFHRSLYRDL